ncbi:uncharacterized protein NEMAJ01_1425 [Nematocida major]|uniref:uncharacterized protein n=1 Tax=Nematocida major TaxID=1912982 RepID=UPI0020088A8B|nr:uncharacterized protein NEMAJ01_1425 [Nematocida major]KAH9386529.1 hypothetical protein NEMAJ01_1425 [Nematocida major]
MLKEIHFLLKETHALLDKNSPEQKDDIHSKIVGIYLTLQEYTKEDREVLIEKYNELVDRGKAAGISKIKKIAAIRPVETTSTKKREPAGNDAKSEKIAASILDHSKTLKKKVESFGQMLENSKSSVDAVSSRVRENVKHVQKGVSSLENKEWYSLSTGQVALLLVMVLLAFVVMYLLIRAI